MSEIRGERVMNRKKNMGAEQCHPDSQTDAAALNTQGSVPTGGRGRAGESRGVRREFKERERRQEPCPASTRLQEPRSPTNSMLCTCG